MVQRVVDNTCSWYYILNAFHVNTFTTYIQVTQNI